MPASINPNEFPAVATQSKDGTDSNEPRWISKSGVSLAAQRISSAVSFPRVAIMKRILIHLARQRLRACLKNPLGADEKRLRFEGFCYKLEPPHVGSYNFK